jgi:hypothetical protein
MLPQISLVPVGQSKVFVLPLLPIQLKAGPV